MWLWVFVAIGVLGAIWHIAILVSLATKSKRVMVESQALRLQVEALVNLVNEKPQLAKPVLAVETPLDEVLLSRYQLLRRRKERKVERERRLIDRLNRIDPTERRFTRAKRS